MNSFDIWLLAVALAMDCFTVSIVSGVILSDRFRLFSKEGLTVFRMAFLFGFFQALMPLLARNNGRIVNVTVPSEISPYWHPLAYVTSKAAQNAMMGVMAMEFQQNNTPLEIFSVHPGPTTTDLNGNMSLPGFHDIETIGQKMAELINDGKRHQGEFIELYPIVEE